MKKRFRRVAVSIVALIAVILGGFYMYTLDYYRADEHAAAVLSDAETNRQIEERSDMWIFHPNAESNKEVGLIFYPGGKVEASAYTLLLQRLAENGITCVLVQMPFNLAVLDIGAADRVYDALPDIKNWMIGGHSLGGAMAGSYAIANRDKVDGLVLLGAYPVEMSDLPILAVYGSEDLILDKAKLEGVPNQVVIPGGNHAYFGHYGEQKGDGTATITREQQQELTAAEVTRFVNDLTGSHE